MTEDTTKPGIEERYSSATNTSTMKMEVERSMPVDVLTAAGWSQSRIGSALLRLHSEWDAVEKPTRPSPGRIAALVGTAQSAIKDVKADLDKYGRLTPNGARIYAQAWHRHEAGLLLGKLKTLPAVRGQVEEHLKSWGMAEPATQVAAVLLWWLDQTCHACHGTKYEVVAGTNRQSGRLCRCCQGSGLMPVPHGQDGKRLANWLDGCTQLARTQISKSLHGRRIRA